MASQPKSVRASAPFRRLGQVVYRRRRYIVVAWILALVLLVPVIMQEGKYTSLQQGSASGTTESLQASNIISAQFPTSVANSTLLVVVTGDNVTSASSQAFVSRLVQTLKTDSGIKGLSQTFDVFSPLYSAVGGLNRGTYGALVGANSTSRLLLGVPAIYVGAWERTYASTHDVKSADNIALNYTASYLSSADATSYRQVSSHLLSLFNSDWAASWSDSALAKENLTVRASTTAQQAGVQYLDAYMPASKAFGGALLQSFTLNEFVNGSRAQTLSLLSSFAVAFTSETTGFSEELVGSAFALGPSYTNSSLHSLVGDIVRNPSSYSVGRQFSTLISSLVSPARDTTLVSLGLNQSSNSNVVALRAAVSSVFGSDGSRDGIQSALVTGGDAISYDFGNSAQSDFSLILPITIILLLVATGIFFRSILAPFMTLGTIGIGLGIAQVAIVLVGALVAKVDFEIPTILLTVLIGVGTDYSVFVTARYREERVNGASVQDAVETSVSWAGESIATSGATVIISFLSLTFTSVTFLKTMGFVVGLGVLIALSVALTMVPALLSIIGSLAFWPNSGERFARYSASLLSKLERRKTYFSRSGRFAVKRAGPIIILALVATVPAVYVYVNTTPTYDFLSAAPSNLDSVVASNHLTTTFGGGTLFPTYAVMTFATPVVSGLSLNSADFAQVQSASSYLASVPDVRNVTSPTMPFGRPIAYASINSSTVAGRQALASVLQSVGRDNKTVLLTLNFRIDPYSTQAIADAQSIRQTLHSEYGPAQGVTGVYVGGASGGILDTKNIFDSQFNQIVPIVAFGVGLVLFAVLGSLFLPLFAVVSILMSVVWTLAATKLVFQQFFSYQLFFITPFFLFVTLLGLGMDYNIFILTRIREEATHGKSLDDAIVGAIEHTGAVISAAAIILAGSLGALMISSDLFLKQIGFSFAYSILIDALVVRTYLVPAVMTKVGKWNWYNPIARLNRSKSLYDRENASTSTA